MSAKLATRNFDVSGGPRLDLVSLRKLEYKLGLEREYLRGLAVAAGGHYNPFIKPEKLRPFQKLFKKPKKRIIDNPNEELKESQKRVYRRLLRPESLPDYIFGGVTGKKLTDNINVHLGARLLVTVDIASFSPTLQTNTYIGFGITC